MRRAEALPARDAAKPSDAFIAGSQPPRVIGWTAGRGAGQRYTLISDPDRRQVIDLARPIGSCRGWSRIEPPGARRDGVMAPTSRCEVKATSDHSSAASRAIDMPSPRLRRPNGQTELQINGPKTLKPQMNGPANIDLLKARLGIMSE